MSLHVHRKSNSKMKKVALIITFLGLVFNGCRKGEKTIANFSERLITREMIVGVYENTSPGGRITIGFVFLGNGNLNVYSFSGGEFDSVKERGAENALTWELHGSELHLGGDPSNKPGEVWRSLILRSDLSDDGKTVVSLTGIGKIYGKGKQAIRDIWDEEFIKSNPPFTSRPVFIKVQDRVDVSGEEITKRLSQKHIAELAWIYFADSSVLSEGEYKILLNWGSHGRAWNKASSPIVRDYLDQEVSAADFVLNANRQLIECRAIIRDMNAEFEKVNNKGVKKKLEPLVQVHFKLIKNYELLCSAISEGKPEEERVLWANVGKLAEEKKEIWVPVMKRMMKIDSDKQVDKIWEERRELWRKRLIPPENK